MDQKKWRSSPMLWVGLGLTLALLLLALLLAVLKLKQASKADSKLPVLGTVVEFTLTNQDNQTYTLADLKGKVWVADIIFTRCAGPCPRMTQYMSQMQEKLDSTAFRLVTLTTDPEFDTPPVLKVYAERFGADPEKWQFLTGTKEQIAGLATGSLKLLGLEKAPEERQDPADLFIHSTMFVLVDKQARLRGVYETEPHGIDPRLIQERIVRAAKALELEP